MFNSNVKGIKKFTIKLCTIALPIAIAAYPIDLFLSKIGAKNSAGEIQVWNDLYTGKVNSDLVIYGASRAWIMVNPEMIAERFHTTAYNLGVDGHSFDIQAIRHRLLLKYNKMPKVIIQILDYSTFSKRSDLYLSEQFLPFMLWNSEISDITKNYEGFDWEDYNIPLLRYYGKAKAISHFFNIDTGSVRVKGYRAQNIPWNNSRYNGIVIAEFNAATLKRFDSFLAECKKLNIKVILVYAPEYYWGQNKVINRAEVFDKFSAYIKKYDVPFFDYSMDSLSYQRKYFYNTEHLNTKGSALFTRDLIDTLKKTHLIDAALKSR